MMIAMVMALGAAESAAAALSPTSKWDIQYADDMCVAQRAFGTGPASVVFGIRPWPRSEAAEIILATKEATGKSAVGEGTMLLAPSGKMTKGTYSSFYDPKSGQRVTQLRVTADDIAQMAAATTMTITVGKQRATLARPQFPQF